MKVLAFFNNKGGVGKTTLVYHLAWMFSKLGKKVLVADLDPQANLTSMFLEESILETIWSEDRLPHASIMQCLDPIIQGTGDIAPAPVRRITPRLSLIPGDLELSRFEAKLSEAWGKCLDRDPPSFRVTTAFHRILREADNDTDIALIDVGPNFGATNRAALICADGIVVPLAPDLFSLQGLRNLGPTLAEWRQQWATRAQLNPVPNLSLPAGLLSPLGYVLMQFGIRDNRPVKAYERWGKQIPATYLESVRQAGGTASGGSDCLAMLKHYRSLMPMAMDVRKPVFDLKSSDGAIGAHLYSAQESFGDFKNLAHAILGRLEQATKLAICAKLMEPPPCGSGLR